MPLTRTARALRFSLIVAAGPSALSLTGAPTPKYVARLADVGVDSATAGLVLHLTPIAVGALLCGIGQWVALGQTRSARFAIYAALGLVTGLVMGLCLDLFAAATTWVNTAFGPSSARGGHAFGWAAAAISLFWGLLMAVIALFGSAAARAL
jgi:hypothetical protein